MPHASFYQGVRIRFQNSRMNVLQAARHHEVQWIIRTLYRAMERLNSGDFLDGFPWTDATWHQVSLERPDFEKLYLFWDGIAWGDKKGQRTLATGVEDFQRMSSQIVDATGLCLTHLLEILGKRDAYRVGTRQSGDSSLILVDQGESTPGMILDGNHRAVASLWWTLESKDECYLPRCAWLGRSLNMGDYRFYPARPRRG